MSPFSNLGGRSPKTFCLAYFISRHFRGCENFLSEINILRLIPYLTKERKVKILKSLNRDHLP